MVKPAAALLGLALGLLHAWLMLGGWPELAAALDVALSLLERRGR